MELRYLRYFIAVANHRHFTRAAESLGMAPPPLSQQIKKLERELGTPLFRRLSRGVELTEVGKAFYVDANQIIQMVDLAVEKAQGMARGENGTLCVGFASSTVLNPLVLNLLHAYRERYPQVEMSPKEETMMPLLNDLRSSEVDLAIIRLPCESSQEFMMEILVEEPMLIVLPKNHRLSARPAINLHELENDMLITFPPDLAPSLYDSIFKAYRKAGLVPRLGQQAPQLPSSIAMVQAGFGVTIVPQSLCQLQSENLSYHDIGDDHLTTSIALAWRRHERSPAVKNMITLWRHAHRH